MSLEEKAKTFYELGKEWMETKLVDDRNNEKWILVSVAQQEIDDCRTSWQNLKDTIPKFDAKISFLETHLEACNRLIDEMQRERGLLKQKLREHLAKYPEDHFVRDAQGDYICDSKGKATGEVFIAKEKDFEKWLKELAELLK
jgi:chromosome segregation ATPase